MNTLDNTHSLHSRIFHSSAHWTFNLTFVEERKKFPLENSIQAKPTAEAGRLGIRAKLPPPIPKVSAEVVLFHPLYTNTYTYPPINYLTHPLVSHQK